MAYEVLTTTVPAAEEHHDLTVAELAAPDGMIVVSAFGNLAGRDPDYGLAFLGGPSVLRSTSVPGGHVIVVDDDGHPVRVVFYGMVGVDLEVGIVCVGDG